MTRLVLLLTLLLPCALAIRCYFQSDPLTEAGKAVDKALQKEAKEYECPKEDQYCIYFEGALELNDKNQTFSVKSCQSDVVFYLNPISEKISNKIDATCKGAGVTRKTVGPISYFFNCCTDIDCKMNSAFTSTGNLIIITALMSLATLFI